LIDPVKVKPALTSGTNPTVKKGNPFAGIDGLHTEFRSQFTSSAPSAIGDAQKALKFKDVDPTVLKVKFN
jgi:hypothetical protein